MKYMRFIVWLGVCCWLVGGVGFAYEDEIVVLETNQGMIEIKLKPLVAPMACENFLSLVDRGYYDSIIFHRVIKNFMIQWGDPSRTGRGGRSMWGKQFKDEVHVDVKFLTPH